MLIFKQFDAGVAFKREFQEEFSRFKKKRYDKTVIRRLSKIDILKNHSGYNDTILYEVDGYR